MEVISGQTDVTSSGVYLAPGKWKLFADIADANAATVNWEWSRASAGPFQPIVQGGAAIQNTNAGATFIHESPGEHVRAIAAGGTAISAHAVPVPE